jgi:hypothetical protein
MRTRLIVFLSVAFPLVLGSTAPAKAQDVHYEVDLGRAAIAYWEDHETERFAFVVAGQGLIYNSDVGRPLVGNVGCAAVGTFEKSAFGCGELSDFSIDTDLQTASATGKIDALIFDSESAKTSSSAISFSVVWEASETMSPRTHGGYYGDGSFLGGYFGAEVARYATEETKGRVSATGMGRNPSELHDAATLVGPNVWLDLAR